MQLKTGGSGRRDEVEMVLFSSYEIDRYSLCQFIPPQVLEVKPCHSGKQSHNIL